ncbi:MAG: rhodanese-like domain-containing protein [Flavobacteriaceae bacterium]|jgi:rhodanese-related sulfurtransferase|nr:rhodanese-like domain-containing protein [Flavobacteriaceae bacterium]
MNLLKTITCFFGVLTCLSCQTKTSDALVLITPQELKELSVLEGIQLIDVRTPGEYQKGHVSNAKNIDFLDANFERNIQYLDPKKPIIVYCQRGSRSAKCASKLIAKGFVKVYDLKGGFVQWKNSGLKVEN